MMDYLWYRIKDWTQQYAIKETSFFSQIKLIQFIWAEILILHISGITLIQNLVNHIFKNKNIDLPWRPPIILQSINNKNFGILNKIVV